MMIIILILIVRRTVYKEKIDLQLLYWTASLKIIAKHKEDWELNAGSRR